jgi:6-phosphogluconolactonase
MPQFEHPTYAYTGCNTVKDAAARKTGNGNGISVYRIDSRTRAWTLVQVCEALPNPGFLVINRSETFLYSAHGDFGELSAYAIDRQSGKLTFVNQQPTDGHNSRHLTISPDNRHIVLNKGTGVAVFPIKSDGSLAPYCENFEPPLGPDPARGKELAPCPHQIVFDPSGRFVIVPDRNLDKVHVYRFDAASGKLTPNVPPSAASRAWAGPRHIDFHPSRPLAYAINETDSTVSAFHWNAERGELAPFQVIATTPAGYSGKNSGSEIAVAPSGKFVYASNRGHDSIAVYSIDAADGSLRLVCCEPSQGKTPRFVTFDASGSVLYAANQDSDTIVFFSVDDGSGKLTPTGQTVETGTPTCIIFRYH